jgi:hypothetical protein
MKSEWKTNKEKVVQVDQIRKKKTNQINLQIIYLPPNRAKKITIITTTIINIK